MAWGYILYPSKVCFFFDYEWGWCSERRPLLLMFSFVPLKSVKEFWVCGVVSVWIWGRLVWAYHPLTCLLMCKGTLYPYVSLYFILYWVRVGNSVCSRRTSFSIPFHFGVTFVPLDYYGSSTLIHLLHEVCWPVKVLLIDGVGDIVLPLIQHVVLGHCCPNFLPLFASSMMKHLCILN